MKVAVIGKNTPDFNHTTGGQPAAKTKQETVRYVHSVIARTAICLICEGERDNLLFINSDGWDTGQIESQPFS